MTSMGVAELLLSGAVHTAELGAAVDAADASGIAAVLRLTDHEDAVVRRAVASTLPLLTHGDPPTSEMVEAAIRLTADPPTRRRGQPADRLRRPRC
jgi:HEAT repeat protein